jgi:putative hydrolase of the HAD superfamily
VKLNGIKGIIFDLGSTLVEYENKSWQEINLEGQRNGYDLLESTGNSLPPWEEFNEKLEARKNVCRERARTEHVEWNVLTAITDTLTEIGVPDSVAAGQRFLDCFYTSVREQATVYDDSAETLEKIHEAGYKTGLISNTIFPGPYHESDLDRFGLVQYLPFRIYSCEHGYRKPHRSIFEEGLRRIGLPAEETMYVGDRYFEDITGPQNVGMAAALRFDPRREYPDPMPDGFLRLKTLSDLLPHLAA